MIALHPSTDIASPVTLAFPSCGLAASPKYRGSGQKKRPLRREADSEIWKASGKGYTYLRFAPLPIKARSRYRISNNRQSVADYALCLCSGLNCQ